MWGHEANIRDGGDRDDRDDRGDRSDRGDRGDRRDLITYSLAIIPFVAVTYFFTHRFLTWNLALVYFVLTLEVLPRLWHRAVRRRDGGST